MGRQGISILKYNKNGGNLMLDKYRSKALEFYRLTDELRAARRIILDNEMHQPTIAKKISNLTKDTETKLKTLLRELEALVSDEMQISAAEYEDSRREGKDTARAGYVQVNANLAFEGLSAEDIVEKYPDYIKNLHKEDKAYQWVIDDLVKAKIRGHGDAAVLNSVVDNHMPAAAKVKLAKLKQAQALADTNKTLAGLMQQTLQDVSKGAERADLDVAETFDELMSGHDKYDAGDDE
jgi:hypothetical protein